MGIAARVRAETPRTCRTGHFGRSKTASSRGGKRPAAGATLRGWWAAIAPELAGHVTAVGYDADSGRLAVCPEPSAEAAKTRLEQAGVIEAANRSVGCTAVRAPGSGLGYSGS
ncbi:DUF721 domain-containing protein [Streptomyces sp. K1PN6]|uniref:DUF721 domain-containing protein n=1 Tax=Streptomyces acidicola TaxID=2596892 RepID=A0A5N8WQR2_9ACTN|nr:DciA family protein [Streptomyces acidicola]MPY49597.1 DUF721 domain-containing protein [Streptomyces acidicola]